MESLNHPHRRKNPLTNEWVLVSPHRTQRPWQGAVEKVGASRPTFDPTCYLCPGNVRANGEVNPDYDSTYVFTNDFPAILPVAEGVEVPEPLFHSQPVAGTSRVICYSPRHDQTLADLSVAEIVAVVATWQAQTKELGTTYRTVQIFENKGEVMGCSNPHPHGQIWASDQIPTLLAKEIACQTQYRATQGTNLLEDLAREEHRRGERVVHENEDWLWIVPFWATWPFEVLLIPRYPLRRLTEVTESQRASLAQILKQGLTTYDQLFETSFPYSMGWHQAPSGLSEAEEESFTLHAHFYPPLLRSATVKKFMVGYEMLGEAQRDLTAEQAAQRLRTAAGS